MHVIAMLHLNVILFMCKQPWYKFLLSLSPSTPCTQHIPSLSVSPIYTSESLTTVLFSKEISVPIQTDKMPECVPTHIMFLTDVNDTDSCIGTDLHENVYYWYKVAKKKSMFKAHPRNCRKTLWAYKWSQEWYMDVDKIAYVKIWQKLKETSLKIYIT